MTEAGDKSAYAGDVSVQAAWDALKQNPKAQLVDVRSAAEWTFVGQPKLEDAAKQPVNVAWQSYPGMKPNEEFVAQVQAAVPDRAAPLYMLCRSGARSRAAAMAMTQAGYVAYNISGGFEGDLDGGKQRGKVGGWKAAGLPWAQS